MQGNHVIMQSYLAQAQEEGRLAFQREYLLSQACTFRIGGCAAFAVWPYTVDELAVLTAVCRTSEIPFILVGNGSNILFDDLGYDGVVIFTTNMTEIVRKGTNITVSCGVSLTRLSSYAAKEGLGGLAFAYGIPGTVGGAVYMNAGAYGGEIRDVVKRVTWYDPEADEFGEYQDTENGFSYRESVYQHENKLILSSEFHLYEARSEDLRAEMNDYMKRRRDKQPLEYPSAGSAFKRYPGYFTAQLIDEAGLKGYTVGGAQIAEKHAGFIINRGGATSVDVLDLIQVVRNTIREKNGIDIEPEIRYIPCPGQRSK